MTSRRRRSSRYRSCNGTRISLMMTKTMNIAHRRHHRQTLIPLLSLSVSPRLVECPLHHPQTRDDAAALYASLPSVVPPRPIIRPERAHQVPPRSLPNVVFASGRASIHASHPSPSRITLSVRLPTAASDPFSQHQKTHVDLKDRHPLQTH